MVAEIWENSRSVGKGTEVVRIEGSRGKREKGEF